MSNPKWISKGWFAVIPRAYFFFIIIFLNQTPFDEIPTGAGSEISLLGFCKLWRHANLYKGR